MSTPATLVPESTVGAPAADPASVSSPDADASEAVAAALAESGADRTAIEGSNDSVILPERDATGKFVPGGEKEKPAAAGDAAASAAAAAAAAAATPAKPAETELDLNLTAEDLAEIEKNPLLRRMYKVMRRGVNKTIEELATQRKAAETDLGLIAAIRKDPVSGLRQLAATLGLPLPAPAAGPAASPAASPAAAPAPKTPLATAEEALSKIFPAEGAKALAPALVEIAKAVALAEVQPLLQPIQADLQRGQAELQARRVEQVQAKLVTALNDYGRTATARGDDWSNDIQLAMSKLVGVVAPGKHDDGTSVTLPEYLDVIYSHVTANRTRTESKARQLARLRAAAEMTEPASVRSTPSSAADRRITADMSDEDATALAIQQSMEQLGG